MDGLLDGTVLARTGLTIPKHASAWIPPTGSWPLHTRHQQSASSTSQDRLHCLGRLLNYGWLEPEWRVVSGWSCVVAGGVTGPVGRRVWFWTWCRRW